MTGPAEQRHGVVRGALAGTRFGGVAGMNLEGGEGATLKHTTASCTRYRYIGTALLQ